MAKQPLRDLSFSQWFYVIVPTVAGVATAWFARHELEPTQLLTIAGGGLGLSLLLGFLMVYGEDL